MARYDKRELLKSPAVRRHVADLVEDAPDGIDTAHIDAMRAMMNDTDEAPKEQYPHDCAGTAIFDFLGFLVILMVIAYMYFMGGYGS